MVNKLFQFGEDQAETLETLAHRLGQTQVGIIRDGFRLFRKAVSAAEKGGRIATVGADGTVSPIQGSWDDLEPATK